MNTSFSIDKFLHWLFLIGSTAIILISFCLRSDESGIYFPGTNQTLPSMCSSKLLFGIDCPGCGMTRAFIAISNGKLSRAWELNRASFFVYAFVAAQIPWHIIQLVKMAKCRPPIQWIGIYFLPIGLSGLLLVNWMLKMFGV